jgi:serine phosphatase RsbU (regulator of sigma subunit)
MTSDARRFARRTLTAHILLLAAVLALVALAARKIYFAARGEVIAQARSRQQMLARGTARGIENHYASVISDMDLLRQAGSRGGTARAALLPGGPAVQAMAEKALDLLSSAAGRAGDDPGVLLGGILSRQLEGRVDVLFSASRVPRSGRASDQVRPLGESAAHGVSPEAVMSKSGDWVRSLKAPSVGPFERWGDLAGNLIGVPAGYERVLVAVVPIERIDRDFLRPLDGDSSTRALLVDQGGAVMAASRPDLVGIDMASVSDAQLSGLSQSAGGGTELIDHGFTIGRKPFGPSMLAAEPVSLADRQWKVIVVTSLQSVDGSINTLFRQALVWGGLVVIALTGILASTAGSLIRSRLRVERLRHDLLAREVAQAREIQLAWLPAAGRVTGQIDVAAVNRPARHVSGDFYNWFDLPDGRLAVAIGDVTGHGIPAAFLMATAQLITRNTLARLTDPGTCMEDVNRQLCIQAFNGQFVTMLVAVLDPEAGQVQLATAGHPAPLLIDGDTTRALPVEPQFMLGVESDATYLTETYDLPAGASLLLYTDGVIECLAAGDGSAAGERFGTTRLAAGAVGRLPTARDRIEQMLGSVDAFRGGRELDDDLTIVAVQLKAGAPMEASVRLPAEML